MRALRVLRRRAVPRGQSWDSRESERSLVASGSRAFEWAGTKLPVRVRVGRTRSRVSERTCADVCRCVHV